jgi:hypothetical protein
MVCRGDLLLDDKEVSLYEGSNPLARHVTRMHEDHSNEYIGARASHCLLCRTDLLVDDDRAGLFDTAVTLDRHIRNIHSTSERTLKVPIELT